MNTKLPKHIYKTVALSMTVGTLLVNSGIVANAQPKVMKDGTTFDAEYYAQRYADVTAVYGTEESSLFQHYTDYGRSENREAVKTPSTKTFDPVYYAQENPDVVAIYGTGNNNLYQHYLQFGIKEGRKATANSPSAIAPSTETNSQTVATSDTATPVYDQPAASAQINSISDDEAENIFREYANNIVSNMPESVCAFFDTNGDMNIAGDEMTYLIAWVADNYNFGKKTEISREEIIAMGRAMHDGTFKLPDSPYYVDLS